MLRSEQMTGAITFLRSIKNKGALFAVASGHEALIEEEMDVFEVTVGAFN